VGQARAALHGAERMIKRRLRWESGYPNSIEMDHITSWKQRGKTIWNNLAGICRACNRGKQAMSWVKWLGKLAGK
jgi:5-methylcytosine-specific restriction endonuclease McrA